MNETERARDVLADTEIMLDIYSGLPNPRWPLTSERVAEMWTRLQNLRPAEPKRPPQLGYRGFLARDFPLATGERLDLIRIFAGVITFVKRGRVQHFRDDEGLETLLIGQAEALGFSGVLAAFRTEGAPPSPSETEKEGHSPLTG